MDFPQVWSKVGGLEGETFQTGEQEPFSYRFRKTYVVVSTANLSIPRTNFEKVFRQRNEHARPTVVQGQKYIHAIFDDPRLG